MMLCVEVKCCYFDWRTVLFFTHVTFSELNIICSWTQCSLKTVIRIMLIMLNCSLNSQMKKENMLMLHFRKVLTTVLLIECYIAILLKRTQSISKGCHEGRDAEWIRDDEGGNMWGCVGAVKGAHKTEASAIVNPPAAAFSSANSANSNHTASKYAHAVVIRDRITGYNHTTKWTGQYTWRKYFIHCYNCADVKLCLQFQYSEWQRLNKNIGIGNLNCDQLWKLSSLCIICMKLCKIWFSLLCISLFA